MLPLTATASSPSGHHRVRMMVLFSPVGGDDSANEFHLQELHVNTSVELLCNSLRIELKKHLKEKDCDLKYLAKKKNQFYILFNSYVKWACIFSPVHFNVPFPLSRHASLPQPSSCVSFSSEEQFS